MPPRAYNTERTPSMTTARKLLLSPGKDAIYHCWSRCVRRSFLCGVDSYTGKCFDHRKEWVRSRMQFLSKVFAIEVLAYALMSNHKHSLLRTLTKLLQSWSPEEVARRWLLLYPKGRDEEGNPIEPTEQQISEITRSKKRVRELRKRLGSISWYMKALNEHIARKANEEDGCTGSFWEGRFKSKRIEDEAGLVACSVYIDLNPVRAKLAQTPEDSEFTSIQERALSVKKETQNTIAPQTESSPPSHPAKESPAEPLLWIAPLQKTKTQAGYLDMTLESYLTLVDITGRMLQEGKAGQIPEELPPIMERLGIEPSGWRKLTTECAERFSVAIGSLESLKEAASRMGKQWVKGQGFAKEVFR